LKFCLTQYEAQGTSLSADNYRDELISETSTDILDPQAPRYGRRTGTDFELTTDMAPESRTPSRSDYYSMAGSFLLMHLSDMEWRFGGG